MIAALPETPVEEKDRITELQETVSASRLSCFHGCRLKFFFRYVERLKSPISPALYVGKAVHAVLQEVNLARWHGKPLQEIPVVFDDCWVSGQDGEEIRWEDEPAQKAAALQLVETYLAATPIPLDEKPVGVEVMVEANLDRHGLPVLIGVLDLVRPGGKIVDYKTSSITPQPDKVLHTHESQLSCYCLLYRDATGKQEAGIELHHLVKLKTPKVVITEAAPMTPGQETRLFRSMESYLDGLDRRDFVPSPGMQCNFCEHFGECRKWKG